MAFADANQGKEFFISRIVAQAESEGVPLAEVERKMLWWTEVHPMQGMTPAEMGKLAEEFSEQYDDQEWEVKISGLIRRAYEADLRKTPELKDTYKSAYGVLSKEDHYILVMVDQAIGGKLKWLGLF